QLRCTLMALLLYLWRRRLHSKILPNELSSWRCHFVVPTASSSNLLNGLLYPHHCDIAGLVASGAPIVPQLALFSCFVVTGTGHADLLTTTESRRTRMASCSRELSNQSSWCVGRKLFL